MESEWFEELIRVIEYFWHRYAGLPCTSKYSANTRSAYFKQSRSMLSALLQFCVAADFVHLRNHSVQNLLKHCYTLEYHCFSQNWRWIEAKKLSKNYKQNVVNQLIYYTQPAPDHILSPRIVSTNIIYPPDTTHYISGIVRRFQTRERLIFFLYSIENKYTSQTRQQQSIHFTDKEKLRKVYELYFQNPNQNLRDFILQQGLNYREFQKSFQQGFGATLYDYHHKNKLLLSLAEIMFTSKIFKEIAYDVGYENYISYYRSFVKNFSKTPKEVLRFRTTSF